MLTQDRTKQKDTSTNDTELRNLANLIGNGLIDWFWRKKWESLFFDKFFH